MDTKSVDVHEAQRNLPALVALAMSGSEVILTEGSKPVARLVPLAHKPRRVAGLHAGAASMAEDFDAPLPEEFWLGDA